MALDMQHGGLLFDANHAEIRPVFSPLSSRDRRLERHSIVAIAKESFEKQNSDIWGDREDRFLYEFDDSFRSIFTQWTVIHALDHYSANTATTRDLLSKVIGGRSSIRAVARLHRDTAEGADAATVAREIVGNISDYLLWAGRNNFYERPYSRDETKAQTFTAFLRETLLARANQLVSDVTELNSILNAQASLLSAYANLRLQPWIIFLAIISAIAGGIGAIPPARELYNWGVSLIEGGEKSGHQANVKDAIPLLQK